MPKYATAWDTQPKEEKPPKLSVVNIEPRKVPDIPWSHQASMMMTSLKTDPSEFTGLRLLLHRCMSWRGFDACIGIVITFNAFTIGVETQSKATVPLGCTPDCDCEQQLDSSLECHLPPQWLRLADICFFGIYLLEIILRLGVYGILVLKSHWVKFDLFLVLTSASDFIMAAVSDSDELKKITLVRMLRLFRLARAVRLMVQFQTLWKLVQGLFHATNTLLWTFVLVTILMYVGAVVGMEFIKQDPGLALDHPYNTAAADNFGRFEDSMLFLLQIFSFDSIGGVYRPLIKHRAVLFFYFMPVMLLLSISLMNLVTAVMVNSSLDQANEDKEAMKAWEKAKKEKQMEQLKEMFLELDEDGSGELSMDEVDGAPADAHEQLIEIAGTDDLAELFHMLDYDGGGTLGVDEFCEGVLKATTCQPGTLELGRLVKQCADILQNNRDSVDILTDPKNGIRDFFRRGGGGGGDGGRGKSGGHAANIEVLSRVDRKVSSVEKDISQLQTDLQRIRQLVNDNLARSKTKSIPSRNTLRTVTSSSTSRRHQPHLKRTL